MKLRQTYWAMSLLFLVGILLSDQATIRGIVVDNENQNPIHGADVYVEKLGIGTTSQVNGQFTIDPVSYTHLTLPTTPYV